MREYIIKFKVIRKYKILYKKYIYKSTKNYYILKIFNN